MSQSSVQLRGGTGSDADYSAENDGPGAIRPGPDERSHRRQPEASVAGAAHGAHEPVAENPEIQTIARVH